MRKFGNLGGIVVLVLTGAGLMTLYNVGLFGMSAFSPRDKYVAGGLMLLSGGLSLGLLLNQLSMRARIAALEKRFQQPE